jgi:hypothetical protein
MTGRFTERRLSLRRSGQKPAASIWRRAHSDWRRDTSSSQLSIQPNVGRERGTELAGELFGTLDPPRDAGGFEEHLRLVEVHPRSFLLALGVGDSGQIQVEQGRLVW